MHRRRRLFNPENYCLIYAEAMHCDEMRRIFKQYLSKSRADEPLLFLEDAEVYSAEYFNLKPIFEQASPPNNNIGESNSLLSNREITRVGSDDSLMQKAKLVYNEKNYEKLKQYVNSLYSSLKKIIEEYIPFGSPKELNLNTVRQETIDEWDNITTNFNQLMSYSNNSNLLILISQMELIHSLYSDMNPGKILEKVLSVVNMDLKIDQFPRFSRLEVVRKFLLERGENFTRTVAIDISKGYRLDLRFKPKDLKEKEINDNHIYFAFTLAEDTPDWELVFDKKGVQTFISKTPYCFSKDTLIEMQLAKAVFTLPYNIDDVWACCWNTDTLSQLDPMVFNHRKDHKYAPPSNSTQESDYGISLNLGLVNFLPGIKRSVCYSSTFVRDSEIDAILCVNHSTECLDEEFPHFKDGHKKLRGFFNWSLYKVSDKTTRIIISTYSEVNVPIFSSLMYRILAIKRTKMIRNAFMDVLDKATDGGNKKWDTSTCVDAMNYKKCLEDNMAKYPNRSWYREWASKQKQDEK